MGSSLEEKWDDMCLDLVLRAVESDVAELGGGDLLVTLLSHGKGIGAP